jgi:aminocarboxymuconate-semialdehyde decarboxylase
MMKILDVQSHYMPPDVACQTTFYKVHWSDVERHLAVMDENAIAQSLLLYPTSDAHLNMGGWLRLCEVYNEGIADVVRKYPQRFIGAGIIPLDQPKEIPATLKKILQMKLRALSLPSSYNGKYLDEDLFCPAFEFAQEHQLPVHVHPQIMAPIGEERVKDPLLTPVLEYVFDVSICIGKMMMAGVFQKFPKVKFVFAHYGGVLPFVKERFDNTYVMLRRRNYVKDLQQLPSEIFRSLYFDTSGSKSAAALWGALEVVDSQHILFGSDFPANQDIPGAIATIRDSALTAVDKENILSGNLTRLL